MASNTRSHSVDVPREDQRNEPFDTPTHEEIVAMTAPHIAHMEKSIESSAWHSAGMHFVLVTAFGRKSGAERKTPLPYWRDRGGHRIIAASFAGAPKNPAWYANMADKAANPTIRVQDRGLVYWSDIEVLDGDEYDTIWSELIADRPFYIDYRAKAGRQIPLIRLPEPPS